MSDNQQNQAQTKVQQAETSGAPGFGKMGIGILSGFFTTFLMNQASLHGIDFTVYGVSSEVVKSGLDGAIIGSLVYLTPAHFVAAITDVIIFTKQTLRSWGAAWRNNE